MKRSDRWLVAVAICAAMALPACSSSGDTAEEEPYDTPDISGLWDGWIAGNQVTGIVIPVAGGAENTYEAVFVFHDDNQEGHDGLMVTPVEDLYDTFPFDARPFTVYAGSARWTGDLVEYEWDSAQGAYAVDVAEKMWLDGYGYEKNILGGPLGGAVRFYGEDDSLVSGRLSLYQLYYNRGFDESPNVSDLEGTWVIEDAWTPGNDLTLTITPHTANTMGGVISGHDTLGNTFSGTITIRVSSPQVNVYNVNLSTGGITLNGLASLALEVNTQGIVRGESLVIGTSSSDNSHMVGGWASRK